MGILSNANHKLPDRSFPNYRAWQSGDRLICVVQERRTVGFGSSEIVKGSVGLF